MKIERLMAAILDGREVSKIYREKLKKEIEEYKSKGYREPALAVILVGDDPASQVYVNNKRKACQQVGINRSFTTFRRKVPKKSS